jgi:pimeloyl-ACP methyl ester carboxylesterase
MEKFEIDVPEAVLADLRRRLRATRWPAALPRPGWAYGADADLLRDLVGYWADGFDWPAVQRRLNRLPQFTADVQGRGLHFVHLRGQGPDPFPLVLTHGWPSSFVEMERLAQLLAEPDDPADAFDVVVPSLPGYGFSAPPPPGEALSTRTASRWASLMVEVLGYQRFGAVGGDVGAGVTTRLGMHHADRVVGIHVDSDGVPAAPPDAADLSPAEREYLAADARWEAEHGGYAHLQGTRPGTLAFGLADSPVGLAAYLVEKYRAWSDCGGDVLRRFSRDDLLTTLTLYWVTGTIGSSFLPYYDGRHRAVAAPPLRVQVPVAVALWREPDLPPPPRELAERSLNVTRWTPMPRGGHFAAHEEPELLAEDVREFFRPLRKAIP